MVAVQAVAWALLVSASVRLRRTATREGETIASPATAARQPERALGMGNWQPDKEDANPVEWLVYRQYGLGAGLWGLALLGLAYGGWVGLARDPLGNQISWAFSWPLGVAAALLGGVIVTWVASRFFVGVRRSGDLELLLTTPLGAESIVTAQWRVLRRVFVWPVLVMQAPMLPQLLNALANPGLDHNPFWKVLVLANTFLGASALCWLGLWFGMRARTQAGAIVWAVGLGKGITSLITLIGLFVSAALMAPFGYRSPTAAGATLWLSELLVLAFNFGVIVVARQRLTDELVSREGSLFDLRHLSLEDFAIK